MAFRIDRGDRLEADAWDLGGGGDRAERGLCELMTGDHDMRHSVVSRLYDSFGRAVADFVTRGAHLRLGSPVVGIGSDT
jgi:hypothetical protein